MKPTVSEPGAHGLPALPISPDPLLPATVVDETLHLPPRTARWLGRMSVGLATVAGAAILLLMFATVADVASRKGGGGGIAGVVEWTEVLLVVVIFAGMMGAELSGAHIRGMSFLTDREHSIVAPLLRCFGSAASALVLAWAVGATSDEALESIKLGEFRMGLIQVPIWPAKLAIPIGLAGFAALMTYRAFSQFREALREAFLRRATGHGIRRHS